MSSRSQREQKSQMSMRRSKKMSTAEEVKRMQVATLPAGQDVSRNLTQLNRTDVGHESVRILAYSVSSPYASFLSLLFAQFCANLQGSTLWGNGVWGTFAQVKDEPWRQ